MSAIKYISSILRPGWYKWCNISCSFRLKTALIAYTIPLLYLVWCSADWHSGRIGRGTISEPVPNTTAALKRILLWNGFFKDPDYGVGFGTKSFEDVQCQKTCYITNDRNLMPSAAAVVIHAFELGPREVNGTLPTRKSQEEIFVFFSLESLSRTHTVAVNSGYNFTDVFNLTITPMDKATTDIVTPIGGVSKTNATIHTIPSEGLLRSKNNCAFWFTSYCRPESLRSRYIDQLSKYIQVDIYGACGINTCPKRSTTNCFNDIHKKYMFYLAFENSYCTDYITEKVYRTLWHPAHVVPVVFGAGNYSAVLPRHSYIDVKDFDSPKHLADYLLYLTKNTTAYREYFLWKSSHRIFLEKESKKHSFCRLCEILHDQNYVYKTHFDALEYLDVKKHCIDEDEQARRIRFH